MSVGVRVRAAVDWHLRTRLPRPAYNHLTLGASRARVLAGRGRGRGRLLPDFVIIGSAKAGTTSLYAWLSQHPFVAAASEKEVHYFDYNYYRGPDWYRAHFPRAADQRAFAAEHGRPFITGEASPSYISHPWAPSRLRALLPQARLIVTLRNPADRAYSQFQMSRRENEEPLEDFGAALAAEEGRLADEIARMCATRHYNSWPFGCWSYLARSRYAEQLERWLQLFGRDQFHFLTLEQMAADPQGTLDGVHAFLGLPPHRHAALTAQHTANYSSMPAEARAQLTEYFRPHNERLYELIGVDLGWELEPTLSGSNENVR